MTIINRRSFIKLLTYAGVSLFFFRNATGWSKSLSATTSADDSSGKRSNGASLVLRITDHRVVRKTGFNPASYLDALSQERLDGMVEKGIMEFTGRSDLGAAWHDILTGYKKGDRIAIKPNLNFINHGNRYTITAPPLINSVVGQLVEHVGVKPEEIFLYDLCKEIPHDIVRRRILHPIRYVEMLRSKSLIERIFLRLHTGLAAADTNQLITMREDIRDTKGRHLKCYMPKVISMSEHIINMPLLTNHIYVANSGALKNHYGTVRFSDFNPYPTSLHGSALNRSITDINSHPQIRKKTRLVIADSLFGVFDRGEGEGKRPWVSFGGDFPKSVLISRDPVAADSVMASMVIRERKLNRLTSLSTDYLADAMEKGLGVSELSPDRLEFSKIIFRSIVV